MVEDRTESTGFEGPGRLVWLSPDVEVEEFAERKEIMKYAVQN